jgi:hypothetical protein
MRDFNREEKTFLWGMFMRLVQFGFNLLAKKHGSHKVKIEYEKLGRKLDEQHEN